jgi:ankyrin repeat protein
MNDVQKKVMAYLSRKEWAGIFDLVEKRLLDVNALLTDGPEIVILLDQAILAKDLDVVRRLISAGADVNDCRGGMSPLMTACETHTPNLEIIDELLKAGANVNYRATRSDDGGGETALILAAERGSLPTVQRLLEAGADVTILTYAKETAIFFAAAEGRNIDVTRLLLAARCPLTGTELHWPVSKRDIDTVRLLIGAGCNPNVPLTRGSGSDLMKGDTPIIVAARLSVDEFISPPIGPDPAVTARKRLEMIKVLLAAGADPNVVNGRGHTPLLRAVVQKDVESVRALVAGGAKADFGSKLGTPLEQAKEKKMSSIIELLETIPHSTT